MQLIFLRAHGSIIFLVLYAWPYALCPLRFYEEVPDTPACR